MGVKGDPSVLYEAATELEDAYGGVSRTDPYAAELSVFILVVEGSCIYPYKLLEVIADGVLVICVGGGVCAKDEECEGGG